jgi:hypothetical protein
VELEQIQVELEQIQVELEQMQVAMKGGTQESTILSLGKLFPMTVMKPYGGVNIRLH